MKSKILTGIRVLFASIFVVFGLNGFLMFIPVPPMNEAATAYMMGLVGTGYFMPVVKIVEIVCGVLLLANIAVPAALILIGPVVVHIMLMHVFLEPAGIPMSAFLFGSWVVMMWNLCEVFKPLFSKK